MSIWMGHRGAVRRTLVGAVIAIASLGPAESAIAGHFRFAHLTWIPRADLSATTAELRLTVAFTRSEFGFPIIGDTIVDDIGLSELQFGDGTSAPKLEFTVVSIDVAGDWFLAEAKIPVPSVGTGVDVGETETNDTTTAANSIDIGDDFSGELTPASLGAPSGVTIDETETNDTPLTGNPVVIGDDFLGILSSAIIGPMTGSVKDETEANNSTGTADPPTPLVVGDDFDGELTVGVGSASGSASESEDNDTTGSANSVSLGDDYTGELSDPTDADVVSFSSSGSEVVSASLDLGTLERAALRLFASDGTTVLATAESVATFGALPPTVVFPLQSAGTYYVEVTSPDSCCTGSYVLELRTVSVGPSSGTTNAESESNDLFTAADATAIGDKYDGALAAGANGPFTGVELEDEPNGDFADAEEMAIGENYIASIATATLKAAGGSVAESEGGGGNDTTTDANPISIGDDFTGTITGECSLDSTDCTSAAGCTPGICLAGTCTNVAISCTFPSDCIQTCDSVGDLDFAKFTASAGDTISADLSSGSATLELIDINESTTLASGSSFFYTLPAAGTYYLKLGGSGGDYTVELREANLDVDVVKFFAKLGQIVTGKVAFGGLSPDATLNVYDTSETLVSSTSGFEPESPPYTIPADGFYFMEVSSPSSGSCCNVGPYALELRTAGDTDTAKFVAVGGETISVVMTLGTLTSGRLRLLDTDGETQLIVASGSGPSLVATLPLLFECSTAATACSMDDDCPLGETCDPVVKEYFLEVTSPDACCDGTYSVDLRLVQDSVDVAKFSVSGPATSVHISLDPTLPKGPPSGTIHDEAGDSLEPNDATGTAAPIAIGDDLDGTIGATTDEDFVSFTTTSDNVDVALTLLLGTMDNATLTLFDTDGTTALVASIASTASPAELVITVPTAGTYFVQITSFANCCTGTYTLELRALTLQLKQWYMDLINIDGTTVLQTAHGTGISQSDIEAEALPAGTYFVRVRTGLPSSSLGYGPYILRIRSMTPGSHDPADALSFNAGGLTSIHAVLVPRTPPLECETSGDPCFSDLDCDTGSSEQCIYPVTPLDGEWKLELVKVTAPTTVLANGSGSGGFVSDPLVFTTPAVPALYSIVATNDVGRGAYTIQLRTFTTAADSVDVAKFLVSGSPKSIQAVINVGDGTVPGELIQADLDLIGTDETTVLASSSFFANTGTPLTFNDLPDSVDPYFLRIRSSIGSTGTYTMELRELPTPGAIIHEYPAEPVPPVPSPTYFAQFDGCCRYDGLENCRICEYTVQTEVGFGITNSSPVSSLPPVVNVPDGTVAHSFFVPAADADGDDLSWRFSESFESDITETIGDVTAAPSINSATGEVTWDTTGTTVGEFYTMQVSIDEKRNGSHIGRSAIDFLIEIVDGTGNTSPTCSVDPDGSPFKITEEDVFTLDIDGADVDGGDTLTLNSTALPAGATMTDALPVSGSSPISSTFDWTPAIGQAGLYSITFIVTDAGGLQALCAVEIEVNTRCDIGGPYTTTCNGSSTSVTLDASGSGTGLTYLWTTDCGVNASFDDDTSETPILTIDPVDPCDPAVVCNVDLEIDNGSIVDTCSTTVTVCDVACSDSCEFCDSGIGACEHCLLDTDMSGTIDDDDLDVTPTGLDFGANSGCFNQTCAECADCPEPQALGPFKAAIELVVTSSPGGSDEASSLPNSKAEVTETGTFFVEVWAQVDKTEGLARVGTDIFFDNSLVSAVAIAPTALFNQFTGGTINNPGGEITGLTGSHAPSNPPCTPAVGATTDWARVAVIEFTADVAGTLTLTTANTGDVVATTAVCGGTVLPATNYGTTDLEVLFLGGNDCTVPTLLSTNSVSEFPDHGGWFRFVTLPDATFTGVSIETCGSDFDTMITVYSKCGGRSLAVNDDCSNVPGNGQRNPNASCFDPATDSKEMDSCLCIQVMPDEEYFIEVTDANGDPPPPGSSLSITLDKKDDCPSLCAARTGSCSYVLNSRQAFPPGCEDESCCEIVCGLDAFCCTDAWDSICADLAIRNCPRGACCHFDGKFCTDGIWAGDCDDPSLFFENKFCEEIVCVGIPTVSEWGLLLMTLLGSTIGTIHYRRRDSASANRQTPA